MPVQVTVLVNILASVDSNPPEIRLEPYHLEIAAVYIYLFNPTCWHFSSVV